MNEGEFQVYEFDGFRVDVGKRLLTKSSGEQVILTSKVFDTLVYLVRHPGKVIGKDELMREIWTDSVVEENNLNQNISTLRRIFGEKPGEQRFIVTVAGHGYRFVPDVRTMEDPGSGIAIIKPEEIVLRDQTPSGETPRTKDAIPGAKSGIKNRSWLTVFAVLLLLSLGAVGFYFWRGNAWTSDGTIKTIAVLPFKPLVSENRNEALELGMAESLIAKLSGSQEVAVRPLSSVRKYASPE